MENKMQDMENKIQNMAKNIEKMNTDIVKKDSYLSTMLFYHKFINKNKIY